VVAKKPSQRAASIPESTVPPKKPRAKTPTFITEIPLQVTASQAKELHAHLEAARQLYNAILSEGQRRLRRMRDCPDWHTARLIPPTKKAERQAAFAALRSRFGFSDYALQAAAKDLRTSWIADHIDAVLAQTLATRAYQALQRVCVGQARRVRFKSKGRGLSSIENKRNDTGLRFVLSAPEEGSRGFLRWHDECIEARIDWSDPVIAHGLKQRIKYVRLVQRKASSPRAAGADLHGDRYSIQLIVEGHSYTKPKHPVGSTIVGADLGPSTIAIVPREGEAQLSLFCAELDNQTQHMRRVQRQMERQRRAANPENYDAKGRIRHGKRLTWKSSRRYQRLRARKASIERKRAAHRKSLHGKLAHDLVARGNHIQIEKISYKAWQKSFGKSVGMRAPGLFVALLRRIVARTGGTLLECSTHATKLSQFCHGCGSYRKKSLRERVHCCPCGISAQRDLYSAFLAAYLDPDHLTASCAQYARHWEGAEARLQAAYEDVQQRAKDGQWLPGSMAVRRARARQPESLNEATQEPPLVFRHNRVEAWKRRSEPLYL
jgi:hypothetical protein